MPFLDSGHKLKRICFKPAKIIESGFQVIKNLNIHSEMIDISKEVF